MRPTIMFVVLFVDGGQVNAQELPVAPTTEMESDGECRDVSPSGQVILAMSAGGEMRGTLLCLSGNEAQLLEDGRLLRVPLGSIRRIMTPADPVWDGAVKDAVIPLIFWAVFCHDCSAEPFLKMSATYGLIGLTGDVIDSNRKTLYRGGRRRSLSVGWRVRF